jgi:hypothetical protein
VEILDNLDRGMRTAVVRHHYGVNESNFVLSKAGEASILSSDRISCVSHCDPFLEKMETSLHVWLEHEAQTGLSVSGVVVSR